METCASSILLSNEVQPVQQVILPDNPSELLDRETAAKILTTLTPVEPSVTIPKPLPQPELFGEEADLISPVVITPVIPPHLMGRDLNNPEEDLVGSKRKLQKPRPGVKVPYRNLTSQIVTQEEIAQEIFERSLKKNPFLELPPTDIFFAKKLTQRLANRLSPALQNMPNLPASEAEIKMEAPQSVEASRTIPVGFGNTLKPTPTSDPSDLIAILEADDVGDWMPREKMAPITGEGKRDLTGQFRLDPEIERELALKQLMELPVRTKKKNAQGLQKTRGGRGRRIQRFDKTGRRINPKPLMAQNISRDPRNPISRIGASNFFKKRGRKRRIGENTFKPIKMPRKDVPQIKTDFVIKQETSSQKQSLCTDTTKALSNGDICKNLQNLVPNMTSSTTSKQHEAKAGGIKQEMISNTAQEKVESKEMKQELNSPIKTDIIVTEGMPKTVALIKQRIASLHNTPLKITSPTVSEPSSGCKNIEIMSQQNVNEHNVQLNISPLDSLPDDPSESDTLNSRFSNPPKTYSQRRKFFKTENDSTPKSLSESMNKVPVDKCTNSVTKEHENSDITVLVVNKNILPADENTRESVSSSESNKKRNARRMKEIDRLLQDEGAINLLYEAEHGDSKRRSGIQGSSESTVRRSSPLKSIRRQKKDLLLKTRLVKNAVLRLSNSPSLSPAAAVLKSKRLSEPPVLQATERDPYMYMSPERRRSIDSRDSLCSPTPMTPLDPPSPSQGFSYQPRQLPAEASRIIRRHSSSSNFSSRSTSPNTTHRLSFDQEKSPDNLEYKTNLESSSSMKTLASENVKHPPKRKKGVPIFVRKFEPVQTYRGKKKINRQAGEVNKHKPSKDLLDGVKEIFRLKDGAKSSQIAGSKKSSEAKIKLGATTGSSSKISNVVKKRIKAEMTKNFHKTKLESKQKNVGHPVVNKTKLDVKNKQGKVISHHGGKKIKAAAENMPELTACLAEAATAFASETKPFKKVPYSYSSKSPSPSHSQSSKNSTPNRQAHGTKREQHHPLSPDSSSYKSLVKSLENEGQQQTMKQYENTRPKPSPLEYKEICLRRFDNAVQVIISPVSTKMKNAFNIQVLRELTNALQVLKRDETCKVVLFSSTGNTFCQGIDLSLLIQATGDQRIAVAKELVSALKDFIRSLAFFTKPLIAGVHNIAMGLGVTMLPFFDMVLASDKATFSAPYCKFGQIPEGGASITLPLTIGNVATSEMLFGGRTLTACEALQCGLITRILWHDKFQEELIPAVKNVAAQSSQAMEATKALLRHSLRAKLNAVLEAESQLLIQHYCSAECQNNFKLYLEEVELSLQCPNA